MYKMGTKVKINIKSDQGAGEVGIIDCSPLLHNKTKQRQGMNLYYSQYDQSQPWSICQRLKVCIVLTKEGRRHSVSHKYLSLA